MHFLYDIDGAGRTDHAESVEIEYDRSQIFHGRLLFPHQIVTEVVPLKAFYRAEYHH